MLQVLGLISCGAVLAAAVTNDNEEDSSVAVASISMLLIAVLSTVKSALDVLFLLIAIPGRIRRAAGVGALHCVPSPMSSPGDSFHRRGSAVELMLYDAVEVDELSICVGPMMLEGDVVGRREEDVEEVHRNPIRNYVNPVDESQDQLRTSNAIGNNKSSFRRSNSMKTTNQHAHVALINTMQSTLSLGRAASNDHIVVDVADAFTSHASGQGKVRTLNSVGHPQSMPSLPAMPATQQHSSDNSDDPFSDVDSPTQVNVVRDRKLPSSVHRAILR
ncbi:Hypothetical protein, putative [Bodo saltans]|uniref:Membrane-associated protein n=1 Tax=Bodo saltans TaxID=75058 RepID=A0A0S4J6S6_BODSA|nr:Hypothetical protein, putative [Bodo saltans]|eukprot:CUG85131.1 Hypothetical protein, putative [Bodo saltans]